MTRDFIKRLTIELNLTTSDVDPVMAASEALEKAWRWNYTNYQGVPMLRSLDSVRLELLELLVYKAPFRRVSDAAYQPGQELSDVLPTPSLWAYVSQCGSTEAFIERLHKLL